MAAALASGEKLINTKKYAKAKEIYEKYLKANPNDSEIRALLQKCETILQKASKLGKVIGKVK
jgi:tetratricopeptide (TPR) repeat protein